MPTPGEFRFLNLAHGVATAEDWRSASVPRLWLYNLHYHDVLNAGVDGAAADSATWLLHEWTRHNPPGSSPGWEPYPTSLRVVNWMRWALADGELRLEWVESLAVQVRWLRRRLEYHLLGNHLWANAKALLFAGAFFEGGEANRWLRQGLDLFDKELDEQILGDGGHYERSPMYQATLAEDVLDLVNLAGAYPGALPVELVGRLHTTATAMLRWLRVMCHPDGGISFFNDAAFGVAPGYAQLRDYALRLGVTVDDAPLGRIEALPESGYVRLQNDRAVAICDVAPVGPDYQPGHAHADTLSFELSLDGHRVFVNSGTSTYEIGELRSWQRSTSAHNTVQVDGEDSSEVWAAFRVARRALPMGVSWAERDDGMALEGAHDGYRRLGGRVTHRRRWWLGEGRLEIEDALDGRWSDAVARLHLHPEVQGEPAESGATLSRAGAAVAEVSFEPRVNPQITATHWYPEFNTERPNHVLAASVSQAGLRTRVSW